MWGELRFNLTDRYVRLKLKMFQSYITLSKCPSYLSFETLLSNGFQWVLFTATMIDQLPSARQTGLETPSGTVLHAQATKLGLKMFDCPYRSNKTMVKSEVMLLFCFVFPNEIRDVPLFDFVFTYFRNYTMYSIWKKGKDNVVKCILLFCNTLKMEKIILDVGKLNPIQYASQQSALMIYDQFCCSGLHT